VVRLPSSLLSVLAALSALEVRGVVRQEPGQRFRR
jgi:hypothetical protein